MWIRNISKGTWDKDLTGLTKEDASFVLTSFEELSSVKNFFGIDGGGQPQKGLDESIRFESLENCDFIGFVRFELREEELEFEKAELYYGGRFLVLAMPDPARLHKRIFEEMKLERPRKGTEVEEVALIYCRVLNNALSATFDSLCRYEEGLIEAETQILNANEDYGFEKIVGMKSLSFRVKKYLRLLLYIGDQMLDNENRFVPVKQIRCFKNLDTRINRLYEFSEGLHEMAEHLLELYDSTMASKTNNLVNKLTLFTVFATPLTVISGIYGMNFAYMPELQHQYGYFIVLILMFSSLLVTYGLLKKIKLL